MADVLEHHKTASGCHKKAFLGKKSPRKIDYQKNQEWLCVATFIRQEWKVIESKSIWGVRYNPQNEKSPSVRAMLPYKRGLNKPFLIFGVSATKVSDILSVFMEIHFFWCCCHTSYPQHEKSLGTWPMLPYKRPSHKPFSTFWATHFADVLLRQKCVFMALDTVNIPQLARNNRESAVPPLFWLVGSTQISTYTRNNISDPVV